MKMTLSVIKADIGSIGGHIKPSQKLIQTVENYVKNKGKGLIIDSYVGHTGDDIAI
ncbi:MAG: fructose 1,6-bisphosphatase, partial [Candidatus Aenigmarchaeota archaeon]|nr:fructose 1,6-bisphosphatase [Candidatus Aenigmarchaeota archaeon]